MARYSEAQNKATQKYQKEHYCRTSVCIPIELKEAIEQRSAAYGGSRNAYILDLIKKDLGM